MKNENTGVNCFDGLVINSCIFSIYSLMGPEAVFYYPIPSDLNLSYDHSYLQSTCYDMRNYMQVSIKSISLLLSDYSFENGSINLEDLKIFGVLPYPDMEAIALTYFFYFKSSQNGKILPASLSLLVHENKRSFIYDSIEILKKPIENFTLDLINVWDKCNINSELEGRQHWDKVLPLFEKFIQKIKTIQNRPMSPITKKRRIKILFTGLENTGKTSFISMVNRKFSEIPMLLPSVEPIKEPLNFLGTTIMKWDIPGNETIREEIIQQSEMYVFETDVIYYFIDVQNPRIEKSRAFLSQIMKKISEYNAEIPIVCIITKVEEDIAQNSEIRKKISLIKTEFRKITGDHFITFFEVSIFSLFSILNAFSYGIRQLSPNRDMIEKLLHNFMLSHDIISGLLLNENGLVLASQEIKDGEFSEILSHNQLFELTAPQFTTIAQQFDKYFPVSKQITRYRFSEKDLVLLHRFVLGDFIFFFLFYTQNPENALSIEKDFSKFIEKITDLIKLYIN